MDPDKVFKFLVDNLADWSRVTVLTLVRPVMRFRTGSVESGNSSSIIGEYNSEKEFWLNPQLLAFALLSIVLGLAINALIPDRKPGPDLLASVIIIFNILIRVRFNPAWYMSIVERQRTVPGDP